MELISKFRSFLAIMFCLAIGVNSKGKSKLKLKLNALENLFRSEMYLINEKLDIGRYEREKLLEKFEETMKSLEKWDTPESKKSDSKTEEEQGELNILRNEIEKLSNKVGENTKDTDELLEALIRIRRGVLEEKAARKSDKDIVIQQLAVVQKNQNETKKIQEELVTTIDSLINNQNSYQNEMKRSQNEMTNAINSVVSNQNNIFSKLDEIVTVQGDLMKKVNAIASQDSVGKLEVQLDKYSNEVESFSQQIGTQITEVMTSAQTVQRNIETISQNVQNVAENVAPKLYCKNQLGLDECLAKHFSVQQDLINTLRRHSLPIMLVGGDSLNEGRVEINHEGRHGTICNDNWDKRDAAVVCRMLGYTNGTALVSHSFGPGTGEIMLDEVECNGVEASLFDCQHSGIGVNDCGHVKDAGVRCDEHDSNQNNEDYYDYGILYKDYSPVE